MAEFVKSSRNKLTLKEFEVINTSNLDYAGNYGANDSSFDIKEFEKQISVKVQFIKDMEMEFDMVGFDPSLVNAIRRILISEVPSMAIEKVHIYQNTSIMQDEVLAHRMGLIPLKADPRQFDWRVTKTDEKTSEKSENSDEGTENDTLQFNLAIRCRKNPQSVSEEDPPERKFIDAHVYTKHIKWIPQGGQSDRVKDPGPVHDDILINKLRPGHEMELELYALKGIGRDHAKFSPVATAFYRLMPSITINREVKGHDALRLQKCFAPGVIELEPTENGDKKAVVTNARLDTCSRNVYRYPELKDAVTLEKIKDHYIFSVESVGAVKPQELVGMACDVLMEKCDHFLTELDTFIKPE